VTLACDEVRRAESLARLVSAGWNFECVQRDDRWICIATRPGLICEQTSEHSAEHALDKALRWASMASVHFEATR
jgi:hypothetical protein